MELHDKFYNTCSSLCHCGSTIWQRTTVIECQCRPRPISQLLVFCWPVSCHRCAWRDQGDQCVADSCTIRTYHASWQDISDTRCNNCVEYVSQTFLTQPGMLKQSSRWLLIDCKHIIDKSTWPPTDSDEVTMPSNSETCSLSRMMSAQLNVCESYYRPSEMRLLRPYIFQRWGFFILFFSFSRLPG